MHGMMIPDRMVVTLASRPRRAALGDQMARRTPGRIQPPNCPLRSVATATGFMQMLRASSNRAAGCCIQGTRADTLIVRRQPNTTGHRTGSPILQGIGQQIMPSHGGKRVGNSQETGPGRVARTQEWDGPLGWAPAASTARIRTLFAGQGTGMRHGMLRRVGFSQKEGAGRELIRRRLA